MKILVGGRGIGKTYQLICESSAQQLYIVCRSKYEATRIFDVANQMKKSIPFPITYEEFINKEYYGKRIRGFLIDDANELLQYMTLVPIMTITIGV